MDQTIYRDGTLLTRTGFFKVLSKTLGATGEHDVWAGSDAVLPQPDGISPLSVSSSSVQDSAVVTDVWTVTDTGGSDNHMGVNVGGVVHAALEMDALAEAINNGTKETWAIFVYELPTIGQGADFVIGAVSYQWLRTTEATLDDAATAIAAVLVADPLYDFAAVGGGSGAVVAKAKLAATETADIVVTITDDGDVTETLLFPSGAASTTHTATESGGTVTVVATTPGVSTTVAADTDNVTCVHDTTGGAGTGLRTLRIRYIDADGALQVETLTLAGTTAVETAADVATLLDAMALTCGSAGAVGTIAIEDGSPATIATIAAGDSEIKRLTYTVPTAAIAPSGQWSLTQLEASTTNAAAVVVRVRIAGPRGARLAYQATIPASTTLRADLSDTPIVIGPGETVRVTLEGTGSTTTTSVIGYGEGVLA